MNNFQGTPFETVQGSELMRESINTSVGYTLIELDELNTATSLAPLNQLESVDIEALILASLTINNKEDTCVEFL